MKLTDEKISKAMSYALRHKPEAFELSMTPEGWVELTQLSSAFTSHFKEKIAVEKILEIVAADSKQRYAIAGSKIRASQGHSFDVKLGLPSKTPPATLYHGTVSDVLHLIFAEGLISGQRQFVHLSGSEETARQVGSRRGSAIILSIDAETAHKEGIEFYVSENNVWLVKSMPAKYIKVHSK